MGARACIAAALVATAATGASAFTMGCSVNGGVGASFYSMDDLNDHIRLIARERDLALEDLETGVTFRIEGRLWMNGWAGIAAGYQHFWGESEVETETATLAYHAPADVFHIGVIAAIARIPHAVDLCLGINRCWAATAYGTNEHNEFRLTEFKGRDRGYEAYAEAHTNFITPIEVGLQVGYRGLEIDFLDDKFGGRAFFDEDTPASIEYSGAFIYLTTAIRIN